jgi:outer membrane protein W
MRLTKVLALVAIVALAVPLANAADSKHKFSFFTGYAMPMSDWSETDDTGEVVEKSTIEADDAMGYGFGYEYRHSPLLSFGASISNWSHDVNVTFVEDGETVFDGKLGEVSWMPLLFDANFHLFKESKIDFYFGPTVGYAMWDDLEFAGEFDEGDSVPVSDQFIYGVNVGLDIGLGENWAISGGLRYLFLDAEIDESGAPNVGVDPILVTIGIGYKF